MSNIEIIQISEQNKSKTLADFLNLTRTLFNNDPNWVQPLTIERRIHLSKQNPYFQHAKWSAWVAYKDNKPVGRISAQIDSLAKYRNAGDTGHFGFFDSINDETIAQLLLNSAESWLSENNMLYAEGPYSLSINDECGLLVDGFDTPPSFMMNHDLPYYESLLLSANYQPCKDLLAYWLNTDFVLPRSMQSLVTKAAKEITLRTLNRKQLTSEFHLLCDIFNDAWSENWGFIPFTTHEFTEIGKQLAYLVPDNFVQIAEINNQAVGMIIMIPNLNEAIADLNGRLLPLGWAKLLWRLKVKHPKTGRVPLMGIRKEYQNNMLGAALSFMLIEALREPASQQGIQAVELSWILENNSKMRNILETLGGETYKRYRLYRKQLGDNQ